MSQAELAAAIGMPGSQSYISAIERGEQTNLEVDTIERIAVALRTTAALLLAGEATRDLSQPPIDLLQTAGYSEEIIARIVESWQRQPLSFRSEVLTRAQRRLERMQQRAAELAEDEHLLAAALHIVPLIF